MIRGKGEERNASNLTLAVGVFLRAAVSVVLCFIVYFMLSVIFNGIFTRNDGYRIVEVDANENIVKVLAVVKYDDPSTHVGNQYDELEANQRKLYTRSEMSAGSRAAMYIVTSIFMWLLFAAFPYSFMWNRGDKDHNLVQYGHAVENKRRGLVVGVYATIPGALMYLGLFASKICACFMGNYEVGSSTYTALQQFAAIITPYRLCNMPFLPLMNAIAGGTPQYSYDLSWVALSVYVLFLLYIPFVWWLGYTLGYRGYSIKEHLVYKKTTIKKK
jgi:hypothetical protein